MLCQNNGPSSTVACLPTVARCLRATAAVPKLWVATPKGVAPSANEGAQAQHLRAVTSSPPVSDWTAPLLLPSPSQHHQAWERGVQKPRAEGGAEMRLGMKNFCGWRIDGEMRGGGTL